MSNVDPQTDFSHTSIQDGVVDLLCTNFKTRIPGAAVFKRQVRAGDPQLTVGVVADEWVANDDSHEIGGYEPLLSRHHFSIYVLVLAANEELGREASTGLAKYVKALLYRDSAIRIGLLSLNDASAGSIERVKRSGVNRQRYTSGEVQGVWNFLSTTKLWVETETIPAP